MHLDSKTQPKMVTFDFTLDNIISVSEPEGTDPDTLHERLREKLIELIDQNCECFMFEGIYEGDSDGQG